ncbi:MAG: serine O-acetyltransferase [Pseudomonadota bacterium]|jgi:serine O-acetyltransferase
MTDYLWNQLRSEAMATASAEPLLADYLSSTIIGCNSLIQSLAQLLAVKLAASDLSVSALRELFYTSYESSPEVQSAIQLDLSAIIERDPASRGVVNPFLNYKGFHALEAYRVTHLLWMNGRRALASHLQGRISEVFAADIHPAAVIGHGVFFDHGTGIVIGETTVISNHVSILQDVTLGGTGKLSGDRHPKIGAGVLIGAGAKVLGNIRVGEGAKIGAGSVVLKEVPAHTTVVGVPAQPVGRPSTIEPALEMDQHFDDNGEGG